MTGETGELYELHLERGEIELLAEPVLIIALDGYIDAGSGVKLAVDHLLSSLEHTVVGTFTDYQAPELLVHQLTDTDGTSFLLLSGPEPDSQWERFVAAVGQVADRFAVRLTVGLMAIPMGVPHTRPTGMSSHATRKGLLPEQEDWLGTIQVPGHAVGLLEYRFGQAGRDTIGFAAHVPHYIARSDYPETARTLIQATADATGLLLPTSGLDSAAATVREELAKQVAENSEVAEIVQALEQQYDAYVSATGRGLLAQSAPLPTADELGAQFEDFLADRERPGS